MLNPYVRRMTTPNPSRDRRTMLVLLVSTVILGGIFVYAIMLANRKPAGEKARYTEENDWGGGLVEKLGYEPVSLPEGLAAGIREDTEVDRLRIRGPAYDFLVGEVADRPFRFFNKMGYTALPGDLSSKDLLADPKAHRAEPMTAKGTLLSLERKPLELPAPLEEVWAGTMRIEGDTAAGEGGPAYAYFEVVDEPKGLHEGQVVQIYGVFYKKLEFQVDDGGEVRYHTGPFFIARKAKRSYIYLDVREIDPAVLRRVRDETPIEMQTIDDMAWYHLASYAKGLDPDTFRREIREDTDMRRVYDFPGIYRGKPVKFRGKLIEIWKVPLEDNPTGLDAYYDAIVHTMDSVTVRVRFVRKPTGVARSDLVSVRGVFLQKYKYEARQARTWPQVPLVVGVTIDRIEFRDRTLTQLTVILTAVTGGLLALFGVAMVRRRRQDRRFEVEYRARRSRRLARAGMMPPAAATPAPPDASSSSSSSSSSGGGASERRDRDDV